STPRRRGPGGSGQHLRGDLVGEPGSARVARSSPDDPPRDVHAHGLPELPRLLGARGTAHEPPLAPELHPVPRPLRGARSARTNPVGPPRSCPSRASTCLRRPRQPNPPRAPSTPLPQGSPPCRPCRPRSST